MRFVPFRLIIDIAPLFTLVQCDEDGSGSISRTELLHSLKAIVTRTIHSSSSNIDELEETKYALIDSVLNDLAVELVELIDKSG